MSNPPIRFGKDNNRFNGGLSRQPDGRWLVICRDYKHMAYARALVAAHIGRLLQSDEIVHHKNGDRTDDRIENLEVVTRAEHIVMHRADLLAGRGLA